MHRPVIRPLVGLEAELLVSIGRYVHTLERLGHVSRQQRREALRHDPELLEFLYECDALRLAAEVHGSSAALAARIGRIGAPIDAADATMPVDEITTTDAARLLGYKSNHSFTDLARRRGWQPTYRGKPLRWDRADVDREVPHRRRRSA